MSTPPEPPPPDHGPFPPFPPQIAVFHGEERDVQVKGYQDQMETQKKRFVVCSCGWEVRHGSYIDDHDTHTMLAHRLDHLEGKIDA